MCVVDVMGGVISPSFLWSLTHYPVLMEHRVPSQVLPEDLLGLYVGTNSPRCGGEYSCPADYSCYVAGNGDEYGGPSLNPGYGAASFDT